MSFRRKKFCAFDAKNLQEIDYKDVNTLKDYIMESGRVVRAGLPAPALNINVKYLALLSLRVIWRYCPIVTRISKP